MTRKVTAYVSDERLLLHLYTYRLFSKGKAHQFCVNTAQRSSQLERARLGKVKGWAGASPRVGPAHPAPTLETAKSATVHPPPLKSASPWSATAQDQGPKVKPHVVLLLILAITGENVCFCRSVLCLACCLPYRY